MLNWGFTYWLFMEWIVWDKKNECFFFKSRVTNISNSVLSWFLFGAAQQPCFLKQSGWQNDWYLRCPCTGIAGKGFFLTSCHALHLNFPHQKPVIHLFYHLSVSFFIRLLLYCFFHNRKKDISWREM